MRRALEGTVLKADGTDDLTGDLGEQGQLARIAEVLFNPLPLLHLGCGEFVGLDDEEACLLCDGSDVGQEVGGIVGLDAADNEWFASSGAQVLGWISAMDRSACLFGGSHDNSGNTSRPRQLPR